MFILIIYFSVLCFLCFAFLRLVWQCCQCLWIVHCWLPLQYYLRLVWPMLPVSLDCPLLIAPSVFSSSCVDNVASVSGLSIVDCPFSIIFVLCGQCCQCLWIVHCWLPLRFSLRLVWSMLPVSLDCPMLIAPSVFSSSCVANVASVSGLSIVDCPFGFLFVLCGQCWQCLCIVYCWLPLRFSLTCI